MVKLIKWLGYGIIILLCCGVLYLVLAFVLARIRIPKEQSQAPEDVSIFILTNGVHTDLVMPTRSPQVDWRRYFSYKHTVAQDSTLDYVAVGWGDKGFYLETPEWKDLEVGVAFNAIFGLGGSALHVTYYPNMYEDAGCKKINITQEQYARLISYVKHALRKDIEGNAMVIETDAQYGDHDAFYEAKGRFNLFKTCNTWANNGLKHCGQTACLWTAFDKGIFHHYK